MRLKSFLLQEGRSEAMSHEETVDIKDDLIFIHWIDVTETDVQKATEEIAGKFEKLLGEIYG